MRVYAISDIHVDYSVNRNWVMNISQQEYRDDILIIAGDITDNIILLEDILKYLKKCFLFVLFVPGNHDLWVIKDKNMTSVDKFYKLLQVAEDNGVITKPFTYKNLSIVPLFGWYDYSFQKKSDNIMQIWADYYSCKWPQGFGDCGASTFFTDYNISIGSTKIKNDFIISYSHFLPRIDIMPFFIPHKYRELYSVLGSSIIEDQIRKLGSCIHVYGHSHVNLRTYKNNVVYINNAYGYPYEDRICAKQLALIYEI